MDKVIVIKELKSGVTKGDNPKPYPIAVDQDNEQWFIWNQTCPLDLNKCYLVTFRVNDKGYKDIEKIIPLVNIFKQKALVEVANRNDVKRDYSIAINQAIQILAIEGKIPEMADVFSTAWLIYDNVNSITNKVMEEINKTNSQ